MIVGRGERALCGEQRPGKTRGRAVRGQRGTGDQKREGGGTSGGGTEAAAGTLLIVIGPISVVVYFF